MNDIKTRSQILRKLCTPNRLNILSILNKQETCVCQMVEQLSIKHNLLSHHLNTLLELGFVNKERSGRHIKYKINKTRQACVDQVLEIINHNPCN